MTCWPAWGKKKGVDIGKYKSFIYSCTILINVLVNCSILCNTYKNILGDRILLRRH